jgi:hypothetical protein
MQYTSINYNDATGEWNITMTGSEWPWMMKEAKVKCPDCKTSYIKKNGFNDKGHQKYRCLNDACLRYSFIA